MFSVTLEVYHKLAIIGVYVLKKLRSRDYKSLKVLLVLHRVKLNSNLVFSFV